MVDNVPCELWLLDGAKCNWNDHVMTKLEISCLQGALLTKFWVDLLYNLKGFILVELLRYFKGLSDDLAVTPSFGVEHSLAKVLDLIGFMDL